MTSVDADQGLSEFEDFVQQQEQETQPLSATVSPRAVNSKHQQHAQQSSSPRQTASPQHQPSNHKQPAVVDSHNNDDLDLYADIDEGLHAPPPQQHTLDSSSATTASRSPPVNRKRRAASNEVTNLPGDAAQSYEQDANATTTISPSDDSQQQQQQQHHQQQATSKRSRFNDNSHSGGHASEQQSQPQYDSVKSQSQQQNGQYNQPQQQQQQHNQQPQQFSDASNPNAASEEGRSVYVENLPIPATEDELRDAFAQYGTVERVHLHTDKQTHLQLGFGFVHMTTAQEAQLAIAQCNNAVLRHKAMRCRLARPKAQRQNAFAQSSQQRSAQGGGAIGSSSHSDANRNLYIGNIPLTFSKFELESAFTRFGAIQDCKVLLHADSGASKGVGFVKFMTEESAASAIRAMHGVQLDGAQAPLIVRVAADRKQPQQQQLQQLAPPPMMKGGLPGMGAMPLMAGMPNMMMPQLGAAGAGGLNNANFMQQMMMMSQLNSNPAMMQQMLMQQWMASMQQQQPNAGATQPGAPAFNFNLPQMSMGMFGNAMTNQFMPPAAAAQAGPASHSQTQQTHSHSQSNAGHDNSGDGFALFVMYLPKSFSEHQLRELFGLYGTVTKANVVVDPHTRETRGFGFVHMSTHAEATKAIEFLNGHQAENKRLRVTFKEDRSKA